MKKLKIYFTIFFLFSTLLSSYAQDLNPEQIYEKVKDCVVVIFSYDFNGNLSKQGSGVVISEKGWVVTNYHVFAECERMEIIHNEKIIKYTDIIGVDVGKDILILKIDKNTFPSIPLGSSDNLKVGQRVYAIGSPLGFENSMSEGIISGLRNIDEKNQNYIQITASISSGSSGGAIVNSKGELIGISTLSLKEGQSLNFAIPVNDILQITIGSFSDKQYIDAYNYFYKGYNAAKGGNYQVSLKFFTKYLEAFPNNSTAYYNRGLSYYYLEDYYKAISDFTKVIQFNPDDASAYYNRGLTLYYLKEYNKAISDYTIAIQINLNYAKAYYNRGLAYGDLKKYFNAISDFTFAIQINPDFSDAYYNRGVVYDNLKEYSKAIFDYTKTIQINPDDANPYYNRGVIYDNLKEYSKALSDYSSAIEINPGFSDAYYNRGIIYLDLKEYSNALSDFTIVLQINSKDADAYYNRGLAYAQLNDLDNACRDWRKANLLGNVDAKKLLNEYCK